jgi:hypothetical protein
MYNEEIHDLLAYSLTNRITEIKKHETCRACSEVKLFKQFGRKILGRVLGRPKHRRENNIKMVLAEIDETDLPYNWFH